MSGIIINLKKVTAEMKIDLHQNPAFDKKKLESNDGNVGQEVNCVEYKTQFDHQGAIGYFLI